MIKMKKKDIENNAEWLSTYNSKEEVIKIALLLKENWVYPSVSSVIDIGCGNGRSIKLLRRLFPTSRITAIDKYCENIDYASEHCVDTEIEYKCTNAFDYLPTNDEFDLALFSWSLFDMSNNKNTEMKALDLSQLLEATLKSIKHGGIVLVLQPSKGGSFEKLLSKFIPGSEEDYQITHKFLMDFGFAAPIAIWSRFDYKDEDQLFRGISSILALECNEELSNKKFIDVLLNFKIDNSVDNHKNLELTDCVNAYYLIKE